MKVLCIGHAAYDITIPMESFPIENSKNRITERIECGGGPASNAAYLLAKWDLKSYFAGIIGKDVYGKRILKEFNDIGVDTSYLQVKNNLVTTSSFIISNREKGTRTILTYRPKETRMDDVDFEIKPNVILIDGQEPDISLKAIKSFPNAVSIIDAGTARKEVIDLAKVVDYVVCSKDFAEQVTNMKFDFNDNNSLVNIYKEMRRIFQNNIIITIEEHGCIYEDEKAIKRMPSLNVNTQDSTGAGDIFHGAFAYGIAKKFSIEKTIKYANIAGAISVTRVGGRYSVPSLEEVEDMYDALK